MTSAAAIPSAQPRRGTRGRARADGNDTTSGKLRLYESRVVWYSSAEMDVTPSVIKLLQIPGADPKDGAAKPNDPGHQGNEKR